MIDFEHERLDVYRAAIAWLIIADEISTHLPRGRAYLVDQLRRAATSVTLNIAEGAGEFSPGDKARFYRMARRSATECAATLDVCRAIKLVDTELVSKGPAIASGRRHADRHGPATQRRHGVGLGLGLGLGLGIVMYRQPWP
jgi:four helix bundle protein